MMITKAITIREDQSQWIAEQHLSLSKFVQAKLDEAMPKASPQLATAQEQANAIGDSPV